MRTAVLLVMLLGGMAVAAPVPKAVRKPPTADGVWECVEVNIDGRSEDVPSPMRYFKVEGDQMSNGRPTRAELARPIGELARFSFRIDDPDRPALRTMTVDNFVAFSAVLELDGDTFRWAWCGDRSQTITECKPGLDVKYYVFQRATAER